jgi:hypothetical protein
MSGQEFGGIIDVVLNSFRGLLLEDVHRLKIGMQELYDIKQEI